MPRRRNLQRLSSDWFMAGVEAQQVIALRMMKLALGGDAAAREAERMVDEKVATASKVGTAATAAVLAGGGAGVPAASLRTYRRAMRANRRRLLKGG